jgi:hypothetical protein
MIEHARALGGIIWIFKVKALASEMSFKHHLILELTGTITLTNVAKAVICWSKAVRSLRRLHIL